MHTCYCNLTEKRVCCSPRSVGRLGASVRKKIGVDLRAHARNFVSRNRIVICPEFALVILRGQIASLLHPSQRVILWGKCETPTQFAPPAVVDPIRLYVRVTFEN
jgi:hypothetical protein